MAIDRTGTPRFDVRHAEEPPDALVMGFSEFGLAGLTAVEYLVDQLDLAETGHIAVEGLPAITPFENGTPRHHTRIFGGRDDFAVLVGELFVPLGGARPFADAIAEWLAENDVGEVTSLSGVPIAHAPDEHVSYYVASEDYQDTRLADVDVRPMGRGFLEGINAELMQAAIETETRVGVITTPVHPQAPDVEAAIRLLEVFADSYDVAVDTGPLETFAAEVEQHYQELADRMARLPEESIADDRMYM